MSQQLILVLNVGSTSLKATVYGTTSHDTDASPTLALWDACVAWTAPPAESVISIRAIVDGDICETTTHRMLETPVDRLAELLTSLWEGPTRIVSHPREIAVVAHRVVFGGLSLHGPTRVTPQVRERIANAMIDAPAHNGAELAAIDATTALFGSAQCQVVVFDTGFHATLPPVAYTYAVPAAWTAAGFRRYGFHGSSHQYAAARAAHLLQRDLRTLRMVTAHLGGGDSLAAIHGGVSVDTTMGFTPMDGLVMATRAGAIDPGLLLHLLRRGTYSVEAMDHILNYESGIKGVSELSGDMQAVLAAAHAGNPPAQLAIDVYVHRARQSIAAMAASMNGVDTLIFTAGVAERSADIRAEICVGLRFLGIRIDEDANHGATCDDRVISPLGSPVTVLVVHAEENWIIAQESRRLLERPTPDADMDTDTHR